MTGNLNAIFKFFTLLTFFTLRACIVWGKTCTGTGNCWLYDAQTLRYSLNFLAAFFVALGTLVDVAVWYYVKDVKIFDDDDDLNETKTEQITSKDDEVKRF